MEVLTREEVTKIARKVAEGENVRLDHYELGNKSEETLGYLGKHLILTLHFTSEKGKRQKRLFLKTYEVKPNTYDFLGETGIFKREQDFYRIVVENMKEYVAEIDWCPEYYFSKERVLGYNEITRGGFQKYQGQIMLSIFQNIRANYGMSKATPRDPDNFLYLTKRRGWYNTFTQGIAIYEDLDKSDENGAVSKFYITVLQDLSEKGFKMVESKQGLWALDNVHVEKALEALATMHATSILLEVKEYKPLSDLHPTVFEEKLYDENKPDTPTRKWINWQIQDLLEGIEYLHKYSNNEKIIIKKDFKKQIMRIYTLSKKSEKYQNVLTHGDIWKNNLLFRYSNKNIPKECKFVDFQFIRYAPPAHDIMHLLHYATKKDMRDGKEHEFLNLYYDSLKNQMQIHRIDIEKKMTREELFESCKEYKELALIQCLLSLHYLLGSVTLNAEKESYEQYESYLTNQRKMYMKKFFHNELYVDKIKDIFHELIDTYILKE